MTRYWTAHSDMDWQEDCEGHGPCLSSAEMKSQARRCSCRGSNDLCPCQNTADEQTLQARSFDAHPEHRTITRAEWETLRRHGYASIRDGQHFVLVLDKATQATVLQPVRVVR